MKSALLLPIALLLLAACSGPVPVALPPATSAVVATPAPAATPAKDPPPFTRIRMDADPLAAEGLRTPEATTEPQADGSLLYRNTELGFRLRIPAEIKDKVWIRNAVYRENPKDLNAESLIYPAIKTVLVYVTGAAAKMDTEFIEHLDYFQIPPPWPELTTDRIAAVYRIMCDDPRYSVSNWESFSGQSSTCGLDITPFYWDPRRVAFLDDLYLSFRTDKDPADDTPLIYRNDEYGFELTIPSAWKDYEVTVRPGLPQDGYARGAGFGFHSPTLDRASQSFFGESEGLPWVPISFGCSDPGWWHATEEERRQEAFFGESQGENTKCVFTTSMTNGSMINGLIAARLHAIMRSVKAIPPQ